MEDYCCGIVSQFRCFERLKIDNKTRKKEFSPAVGVDSEIITFWQIVVPPNPSLQFVEIPSSGSHLRIDGVCTGC